MWQASIPQTLAWQCMCIGDRIFVYMVLCRRLAEEISKFIGQNTNV